MFALIDRLAPLTSPKWRALGLISSIIGRSTELLVISGPCPMKPIPMLRFLLKLSAVFARSWTLSWCLYRLHGIRLVGPPSEAVWYFAYGANMHDSAFCGWRGMRALEWRPARVRGYRLRFNLDGYPRGRAAPANLSEDQQAEVWGVLYCPATSGTDPLASTRTDPG